MSTTLFFQGEGAEKPVPCDCLIELYPEEMDPTTTSPFYKQDADRWGFQSFVRQKGIFGESGSVGDVGPESPRGEFVRQLVQKLLGSDDVIPGLVLRPDYCEREYSGSAQVQVRLDDGERLRTEARVGICRDVPGSSDSNSASNAATDEGGVTENPPSHEGSSVSFTLPSMEESRPFVGCRLTVGSSFFPCLQNARPEAGQLQKLSLGPLPSPAHPSSGVFNLSVATPEGESWLGQASLGRIKGGSEILATIEGGELTFSCSDCQTREQRSQRFQLDSKVAALSRGLSRTGDISSVWGTHEAGLGAYSFQGIKWVVQLGEQGNHAGSIRGEAISGGQNDFRLLCGSQDTVLHWTHGSYASRERPSFCDSRGFGFLEDAELNYRVDDLFTTKGTASNFALNTSTRAVDGMRTIRQVTFDLDGEVQSLTLSGSEFPQSIWFSDTERSEIDLSPATGRAPMLLFWEADTVSVAEGHQMRIRPTEVYSDRDWGEFKLRVIEPSLFSSERKVTFDPGKETPQQEGNFSFEMEGDKEGQVSSSDLLKFTTEEGRWLEDYDVLIYDAWADKSITWYSAIERTQVELLMLLGETKVAY